MVKTVIMAEASPLQVLSLENQVLVSAMVAVGFVVIVMLHSQYHNLKVSVSFLRVSVMSHHQG
jgi:hypothetical protein